MHWYGGSIAEAVTLSKQKNAIFVVFVEGDNDLSTEMAAIIDDSAVVSRLSNQTNFLAVKLKSGTTNYTHFAQIYQFVPVPSLFFIGRNGTPLEVVCAGVQASNLATRIDRILAEHHGEKPTLVQPSTSSSSHAMEATVGLLQSEAQAPVNIPVRETKPQPAEAPSPPKFPKPSEQTPPTRKPDEYEVVCVGDVCVRRPKTADQPSTSQAAPTAPAVTPAAPTVTPAAPTVTPTAPTVTPSAPTVTPVVTPTAPTVTPSAPTVTPVVTPAAPTVTPATPLVTPVVTPTATEPPRMAEASSSDTSVDEKIDRAKELIEAKRREKAELEKELERQKELERRNLGQGVAELKRWQADQEMKQIQEERKREKLENNLARQRILEQIAQDRAERKARDTPAPLPQPSPAPQQTTSHLPTSGDAGTSARVQFKLPDGTSHTAHFDASGTLAEVQRYVADNLQLSSSSFALWTAFPRRELTDASASLRELQLAPSAALLVLPRRAASPARGPKHHASLYAFITQLITTFLYQPSMALYTWIRTRLFPPPAVAPRPPTGAPGPPAPPPTTGPVPRAGPLPRRRTNIHRIPGDAGNDDDNNTWNGNSTQQM